MADADKKKSKKWNAKFTKSGSTKKVKGSSNSSNKPTNEWNLYMPEKCSSDDVTLLNKLRVIDEYLTFFTEEMLIDIDKKKHFTVNIEDMQNNEQFCLLWGNFKAELENSPDVVIGLFGLVMERLIKKNNIRDATDTQMNVNGHLYDNVRKINPRFTGLRNLLGFQDLMTYNYRKFVTIMGVIVRTSDIKPFCTEMAFICLKCQTVQVSVQEKGCYTPPGRCIGSECFSQSFKPLLTSPLTQTVPWKTVTVQELSIHQSEGGRVPRNIECELMHDLTDMCVTGNTVIMSGVLSLNNAKGKKSTKAASFYVLFLNVNSVTCLKGKNVESAGMMRDSLHFKTEDVNVFKQIHMKENLFQLVVASLSPNIYGHELIKAGIVLALFGGSESSNEDGPFSTRENSHVLIVGDPGLGKSEMLLATSNVSPRGVYICGNSTTVSGLTVTISKGRGGDRTLQPGALVLADQGHCCIDEFDKMRHNQRSALLEAMEQQTISMAKSGVVCTLLARTSIVAAANPSGGHYNRGKTVSENLKIGGALLSRFDLVFILQDIPDKSFDSKMTEHVMARHTGNAQTSVIANEYFTKSPSISESLSNSNNNLLKKLQLKGNENINCIPLKTLQAYISYARKYCRPKLVPEVCTLLQNYYLEMRKRRNLIYSTPITIRQLESLVRLTKARARVELRDFCTVSDAEEVVEIMKYSMRDTYSDEFRNIDLDRSIHGSGMSKQSQAKKFMSHLTKSAVVKGDNCFRIAELKEIANKLNISLDSFSSMLETLNDQGYLLKKGFQLYQIQTL